MGAATQSSDYHANLLLRRVAGKPNELSGYQGADILTDSMQQLGLVNTYLVTPYQERARPERNLLVTKANSQSDALLDLDPAMQTTAEEMGTLLSMIYYCTQGKGALLTLYPGELTAAECQELIDIMAQNVEGTLITFGVPADVRVAHKHGWALGTHADAGIVYSPYAPYVLVIYLYQSDKWLEYDYSFPIFRHISRTAYNYFNASDPYLGDPFDELAERGVESPPEDAEDETSSDYSDVPAIDLTD